MGGGGWSAGVVWSGGWCGAVEGGVEGGVGWWSVMGMWSVGCGVGGQVCVLGACIYFNLRNCYFLRVKPAIRKKD